MIKMLKEDYILAGINPNPGPVVEAHQGRKIGLKQYRRSGRIQRPGGEIPPAFLFDSPERFPLMGRLTECEKIHKLAIFSSVSDW
jgi:hypothetical protein